MHVQIQKMNQKGFTLIEIMVVMAVSGLVVMAVVTSIYQIFWGTLRTNDSSMALNEVNNVVPWLKRDIQISQYSNLTNGDPVPKSSLELHWIDLTFFATDNVVVHDSDYSLSGTTLLRVYDGTTRVIGRNITSIGFTQDNYIITCNLTTTGPTEGIHHSENYIFSVLMRSAEVQ